MKLEIEISKRLKIKNEDPASTKNTKSITMVAITEDSQSVSVQVTNQEVRMNVCMKASMSRDYSTTTSFASASHTFAFAFAFAFTL